MPSVCSAAVIRVFRGRDPRDPRDPCYPRLQFASTIRVLDARQRDFLLLQVLALLVAVRDLARLVALEEQDLRDTLVRVDLGRQRRRVGDLERRGPLPFRLEGRDVDDDAAARVGAFSQTDGHHVSRNSEILHRARERKTIWRNDDMIAFHVDETLRVKLLGIDDRAIHIGEKFELVRAADVIAVA